MSNVRVLQGDLLKSRMQTLVNTVNTVGIMGKGIALAFKKKYPEMFDDYLRRCNSGQVRLGRPYPYRVGDRIIVNFPTKEHWRSVSRLKDIIAGLEYLEAHYKQWGIRSIAVPPLGCGNGQLEWRVVGPVLLDHLGRFDIPVELYAPHDASTSDQQLDLLGSDPEVQNSGPQLQPWLIGLAEIVWRLDQQPYHWPLGRIMLQKTAYFATAAGLPTSLEYEPASYGPFAPELKPAVAQMQNNGLIEERQRGRMIEVVSGRYFSDARLNYANYIREWDEVLNRVVDLVARFDTGRAEVAATVHYAATALSARLQRTPRISEVISAVESWKIRRRPPLQRNDIIRAIVSLGTTGWLRVEADEDNAEAVDELVVTGSLPE
jgi:O-acetyl-ADP-ribose deacetylase (regulator of RNase III)